MKILHCRRERIRAFLFLVSLFLLVSQAVVSYGDDASPSGPELLREKYQAIMQKLENSSDPALFHVESSVSQNTSRIDIYGTVKYPFKTVQNELMIPGNWCQIVLSHPDIRACTYREADDHWRLNVYNVHTYSDPLDAAYQLKFIYRMSEQQTGYFHFGVAAQEGPAKTRDHRFGLEAIPVGKNETFIHFRYSFGYNALGYYVMKIFGGSKIGFSVVGKDRDGNPVYVKELRGSAERDVVFHYLAILAYLDTRRTPPGLQYEKRLSEYYNLTMLFKTQLYEMEKKNYLAYKRLDMESQKRLQADLYD